MKTIEQWLQLIPDTEVREKALTNMWWEDKYCMNSSFVTALYQAFNWSMSPEGTKYWLAISIKYATL